jgi:hypothetical protein
MHQYPYEYCSSDVPTLVRPSVGKARIRISNDYLYNVLQCTVAGLYSSHFRGGCLLGQLRKVSRGVAAESNKFRDCKGSKAGVRATPLPLRLLLELGLNAV